MELQIVLKVLIAILIVGLGVFFLFKRKDPNYNNAPDYRGLFIVGATWIPLGIIIQNNVFLVVGAVFMVLGLTNRDKWKKQPKWSEMDPAKRKFKIIIIIIALTVLLVGAILAYLIAK